MKYNHEAARAACVAHPAGERILAYQKREMIPIDSALDDAQDGRLGESVKAFADGLPNFWEAEGDEAAKKTAQDRAIQALRPAQSALDAKILSMVQDRKIFVWDTNDASGVDFADPSAKAEFDAAVERVFAIYLPLLEGTGWSRETAGVVPRVDATHIQRVVRDDHAKKEKERIARLRAIA